MLSDTRYGGWAAEAARRRLGLLRDGRAAGDVLLDGVFVTLLLLAAGVVGGWMAGVLWGAVSSLSLRRWTRALEAFAVALAALPLAVVVALAGAFWAPARGDVWVGAALMLLAGAPLMSLYRNATTRPRETEGFVRTLRSLGVSQWEAGLATVKLSSPVIVTQLGAQASSLLTLAFVVEFALDLPGLGTRTIQALHEPDLNWLMAITVFTVLFVGLLQALSEWLLDRLDPRLRDRGHAWEEPL